ncbi:MAG: hypothetical protein AVO34_06885 [Firmicutes bacterium ML8_F2]|nr:MAG: hypothetical protein AVO34_06885 [Firmicutes bacterium ML8_F2]
MRPSATYYIRTGKSSVLFNPRQKPLVSIIFGGDPHFIYPARAGQFSFKEVKAMLQEWLGIGRTNPWIKEAADPPFTEKSFYRCLCLDELMEKLEHGNWCLGQAFYLGNLCFINQVEGGDEWLVIRGKLAFESITYRAFKDFKNWYRRVMSASDRQLKNLCY